MSRSPDGPPVAADRPTVFITEGRAADREPLVELFSEDLVDLRLPVHPARLTSAVETLLQSSPEAVWLVVARLDHTHAPPVGVVVAHRWVSTKFSGNSLWIETLYVAPSARRHGVGRRLVAHVVERAREEGIRGIDLEAYRMNAPASYLYRALGFRRLSRERYSLPL